MTADPAGLGGRGGARTFVLMDQLKQPLTHTAEPAPTSLCPRTARGHLSLDTPGGISHPS